MDSGQIIKRLDPRSDDHRHFTHAAKPGIVTVPRPKKDLPIGTMKSIEKQSGMKPR